MGDGGGGGGGGRGGGGGLSRCGGVRYAHSHLPFQQFPHGGGYSYLLPLLVDLVITISPEVLIGSTRNLHKRRPGIKARMS